MAASETLKIILSAVDNATWTMKGVWDSIKNSTQSIHDRIQNLNWSFTQMSLVWGAAFGVLSFGIKNTLRDAWQLESSLKGLESVVVWVWQDFWAAKSFLNDFTADGLVPMDNAATSLKNLLAKGFSLDEAKVMMDRFKDAASFGRQAALSLWDAVQGATEGIKNENSMLVDNAWVTKNVSVMVEEYAKSIGKKSVALTEAEKREAIYQGIIKETTFQVWDAAKASEWYQGQLARMEATKKQLSATIGEALMPAMTSLMNSLIPIIERVKEFVQNNEKLVANVLLWVTAFFWFITVLGTLGLAITTTITTISAITSVLGIATIAVKGLAAAFMFLSANPIGLLITAVVALWVVVYKFYKNWDDISWAIMDITKKLKDTIIGYWDAIKNGVSEKINAIKNWISSGMEAIKNIVSTVLSFIGSYYKAQFDLYVSIVRFGFDSIKAIFSGASNIIKGVVDSFSSWVRAVWSGAMEGMRNVASQVWDGIKNVVSGSIDSLSSKFEAFQSKISGIYTKVQGWVSSILWSEKKVTTSASNIQKVSGARAIWGPVSRGKSYLVGENGPELFTPGSSGNITPNGDFWGGGWVSLTFWNVYINNGQDEKEFFAKVKRVLVEVQRQARA